MGEENPDQQVAADPPSDHETPGANPVNEPEQGKDEVQTKVETPGGTTVTEQPETD